MIDDFYDAALCNLRHDLCYAIVDKLSPEQLRKLVWQQYYEEIVLLQDFELFEMAKEEGLRIPTGDPYA